MDRTLSFVYRASVAAVFTFMLLPLLVVVIASVSPTDKIELFPSTISFRWFIEVAQDPRWAAPLRFSLMLGALVAVTSTVLGALGAFAVAYYRCPGSAGVLSFLLSPLSAPQIVKGLALLLLLSALGLQKWLGLWALFVGHVMIMVPFTARMIVNSLHNFDHTYERAAVVLGANRWQVLRHVTLPLIKPGIFAALTLSFVLSFNNIPISLFLGRPGVQALPIEILNYFSYRIDPALAVVNVVCLAIVILIVFVLERVGGFTKFMYGKER